MDCWLKSWIADLRCTGSHWWGEPIVSFVNCCQRHAHLRHLEDSEATYWVCGYANRQHELELEIGADDIMASSFYRALQVASGLLLILDKEAKPFSRTGCQAFCCRLPAASYYARPPRRFFRVCF